MRCGSDVDSEKKERLVVINSSYEILGYRRRPLVEH